MGFVVLPAVPLPPVEVSQAGAACRRCDRHALASLHLDDLPDVVFGKVRLFHVGGRGDDVAPQERLVLVIPVVLDKAPQRRLIQRDSRKRT